MVTNSPGNIKTAATGKILQGQGVGTANDFSTATYPSIATGTGKILRADGTNWVASTATYPDTAGTSGNVLTSDGTNWSSSAPSPSTPILFASGSLTSLQIKALHGTPIEAIAAPGNGKVILLIRGMGKFVYGGTNVFTNGGASNLSIYYGTTTIGYNIVTAADIVGTTTSVVTAITNIAGAHTLFNNTALNLYNPSVTEYGGNAANDNTVVWQMYYSILTI